jgi:hypothetical protein
MVDERDRVTVHLDAEELGLREAVGTLVRERAAGKSVDGLAGSSVPAQGFRDVV